MYLDYKTQATFRDDAAKISSKIAGQPSSSTETGDNDILGDNDIANGFPRNMSKGFPAGTTVRPIDCTTVRPDDCKRFGVDGADTIAIAVAGAALIFGAGSVFENHCMMCLIFSASTGPASMTWFTPKNQ